MLLFRGGIGCNARIAAEVSAHGFRGRVSSPAPQALPPKSPGSCALTGQVPPAGMPSLSPPVLVFALVLHGAGILLLQVVCPAFGIENRNVRKIMIGLPYLALPACFTTTDELVPVPASDMIADCSTHGRRDRSQDGGRDRTVRRLRSRSDGHSQTCRWMAAAVGRGCEELPSGPPPSVRTQPGDPPTQPSLLRILSSWLSAQAAHRDRVAAGPSRSRRRPSLRQSRVASRAWPRLCHAQENGDFEADPLCPCSGGEDLIPAQTGRISSA